MVPRGSFQRGMRLHAALDPGDRAPRDRRETGFCIVRRVDEDHYMPGGKVGCRFLLWCHYLNIL